MGTIEEELIRHQPRRYRVYFGIEGHNAATLWFSCGNGVILCDQERAKRDGLGINYNANFTWSQVAGTIKMQRSGQAVGTVDVCR
ncbi:MAG: hypothetical protein ACLTTW_04435 [Coprobacter sp.]